MNSIIGYGGDQGEGVGTHVTKTSDGGFILEIGSNSDVGTGNIDSLCSSARKRSIFLKYNSDASIIEWTKCYDSEGDSTFEYMFPTGDGGNVLGGIYNSDSGFGFFICKENIAGMIIWQNGFSKGLSAGPIDMMATNDGSYIIVGYVYYSDTNFTVHGGGSTLSDIGVIKIDSVGNKVWSRAIGGSYVDEPLSIMAAPGDGCYIFGVTTSNDYDCTGLHGPPDSAADAYLVRLDGNGNILWHRDLGGNGIDGYYGYAVADGKGGALLVNGTNSRDGDVHHNPGTYNYWALDIDSSNNILWDNCYGTNLSVTFVVPYAICKSADGSIWMTGLASAGGGQVDTAYGGGDAWVVHADSAGNFLSGKVIGGTAQDQGEMIYPLSNGGVITGGYYMGLGGNAPLTYYGSGDAFLAIIAPWTTGVANLQANNINIYPNPASQTITVSAGTGNDDFQLTVYDELGRMQYFSGQWTGKITIDVSGWNSGVYVARITGADGYCAVSKVLIQ
jgi:hypothetical protein